MKRFKMKLRGLKVHGFRDLRITIFIMVVAVILLVLGANYLYESKIRVKTVKYGVTFSPEFTRELKLDVAQTYKSLLDELGVKHLRLPTYWTVIEKKRGKYDFTETDYLLDEAQSRGVEVILVVGIKQPRWPECHIPSWARALSVEDRQQAALLYIKKTVDRYKERGSIWAWQVENEPTLRHFGDNCGNPDIGFLKQEVDLVRKLDKRPIIVTGSGELDPWVIPMQASDIFGTTLYRTVYNSILGYTTYPVTPSFYDIKSKIVRRIFAPRNQKTIIAELQAEPWLSKNNPTRTPLTSYQKLFSIKKFKDNVEYARKTGIDEAYLWGVEWWYFMKTQGKSEYWDFAKTLFN